VWLKKCQKVKVLLNHTNSQFIHHNKWMGKDWHKKGGGGSKGNLSAARGFGCVLATCDVNRAKEGAKELLNLLTQAIEVVYPNIFDTDASASTGTGKQLSMEDALALEIKNSMNTKVVESIQTGVKGLILVKICKYKINPVVLIRHIFNNVRSTKAPCCRHLCRVVPLESVFFANEVEMQSNVLDLVRSRFGECDVKPPIVIAPAEANDAESAEVASVDGKRSLAESASSIEEGDENEEGVASKRVKTEESSEALAEALPHPTPLTTVDPSPEPAAAAPGGRAGKVAYCVLFKKRNHDVLHRSMVQDFVVEAMPDSKFFVNFRAPQVRNLSEEHLYTTVV
jgi:hypothetical protein